MLGELRTKMLKEREGKERIAKEKVAKKEEEEKKRKIKIEQGRKRKEEKEAAGLEKKLEKYVKKTYDFLKSAKSDMITIPNPGGNLAKRLIEEIEKGGFQCFYIADNKINIFLHDQTNYIVNKITNEVKTLLERNHVIQQALTGNENVNTAIIGALVKDGYYNTYTYRMGSRVYNGIDACYDGGTGIYFSHVYLNV